MYPAMKQAILLCLYEFQGSNPALRSDCAACILYNVPRSASTNGALKKAAAASLQLGIVTNAT